MKHSSRFKAAVARLKAELEQGKVRHDYDWDKVAVHRAEVLARYQPVFTPEQVAKISEEEMRDFLMFRNNRHWSGLQRLGPRITEDMPLLRQSLKFLLDEKVPIEDRLNKLVPQDGPALVRKLNRAVITPILLIAFPDKYGVWNNKSQNALKLLDIWPDFEGVKAFGARYVKVNTLLLELAAEVGVDLWTLDHLFHRVVVTEQGEEVVDEEELVPEPLSLERLSRS